MLNCKRINSLRGCAHGIAQCSGLKINICEKRKKQHRWVFQHRNLPRIKGLRRWQPELWNQSRNVQGAAVLVLLALPALDLTSWLWQSRTACLRPRSSRKDEVVLLACCWDEWAAVPSSCVQRALDVPQHLPPSPGATGWIPPASTKRTISRPSSTEQQLISLKVCPWGCSAQPWKCNDCTDFSRTIVFLCTSTTTERRALPIRG